MVQSNNIPHFTARLRDADANNSAPAPAQETSNSYHVSGQRNIHAHPQDSNHGQGQAGFERLRHPTPSSFVPYFNPNSSSPAAYGQGPYSPFNRNQFNVNSLVGVGVGRLNAQNPPFFFDPRAAFAASGFAFGFPATVHSSPSPLPGLLSSRSRFANSLDAVDNSNSTDNKNTARHEESTKRSSKRIKHESDCPSITFDGSAINRTLYNDDNDETNGESLSGALYKQKKLNIDMSKLKKTCESCVKLKVKCNAVYPCNRCNKAGRECVFLPRRPRILTRPYRKRKKTSLYDEVDVVHNHDSENDMSMNIEENNDSDIHSSKSQETEIYDETGSNEKPQEILKYSGDVLILPEARLTVNSSWEQEMEDQLSALRRLARNYDDSCSAALIGPPEVPLVAQIKLSENFAWGIYARVSEQYLPLKKFGPLYHILHRSVKSFHDHFSLLHGPQAANIVKSISLLLNGLDIDLNVFFRKRQEHMEKSHPNRQFITKDIRKRFSLADRVVDESVSELTLPMHMAIIQGNDSDVSNSYLLCCKPLLENAFKEFKSSKAPVAFVKTSFDNIYNPSMKSIEVKLNSAFVGVFGWREDELCEALLSRVSGFLPFGGGLLSFLVADEGELVTFMDVQCVKCSVLEVHGKIPRYSEMPNISVINLKVRRSKFETKYESASFQVVVVVRNVQDDRSTVEEVSFHFTPIYGTSIEHLLL